MDSADQAERDQAARIILNLRGALFACLATWERAESNRGCYSCIEEHDCRCCSQWKKPEPCNCGRVELEASMQQARDLLGHKPYDAARLALIEKARAGKETP